MKLTVVEPGGSRAYVRAFTPLQGRERAIRDFKKRGKRVDMMSLVVLHGWT